MNVEAALVARVGPGGKPTRAVARDPGRDGSPALAATGHRPARRSAPRHGAGAVGLAERSARRSCQMTHISRPSRCSSPSPPRVRRDARARPIAPADTASPTSTRWARGAAARLSARPRRRRRGTRLRDGNRELARRGERPGLRRGCPRRHGARDGPPGRSRRGDHVVSNPRSAVRVADAFSTGSSMMPNKRNPDPALSAAGPRG